MDCANKVPDGYLPDIDGNPVLANCLNCAHITDENDDCYSSKSWYICEKKGREHVSNLKSFPFKTPQKCCTLNFIFMTDWNEAVEQSIANGGGE